MTKILIGVDEAGRGPLAGPVSVGIVAMRSDFPIKKYFPGLTDSKQLSESKREELYEILLTLQKRGEIDFRVCFAGPKVIDNIGITSAVRRALYKGVRSLAPNASGTHVLLDGLLHAPPEYSQETIVRGDESEPVISLASVAAKVRRDRLMRKLSRSYPTYFFDEHKGYGTKKHYAAIEKYGLSDMHRRSFCGVDRGQKDSYNVH